METFLRCLVLSLLLLLSLSACSLTATNDYFTFFNHDSHYTHGTEFAHETKEQKIAVGQRIYTPISKHKTEVVEDERPYAGYLYLDATKMVEVEPGVTLSTGLEIGWVGPGALAEETQCKAHKILGQGCPAGWKNQLENEPGLTFRTGILDISPLSLVGLAGTGTSSLLLELGNVSSALRVDRLIHVDLGPAFLEFGPRLHLVARDIFLDGNTWKTSHSVSKKSWYSEVIGTLGIRIDPVLIEWSLIIQSPQYEEQGTSYNLGVVKISLLN